MIPALLEEMGDDEVMAFFLFGAFGVPAAITYYIRIFGGSRLGAPRGAAEALAVLPLVLLFLLWLALSRLAAVEVRTDFRYQALFLTMGLTWVFLLPRQLRIVGVGLRDDALERRNPAAAFAVAGAMIGLGLVFTGSNMGEGPSIWNTVLTAGASTAFFGVAIAVLAAAGRLGETVAVERDLAAGFRFCGYAAATGLILARASAGNWVSAAAMIRDLVAIGWPALVLTAAAIAIDRLMRPTVANPRPNLMTAGVVPAAIYLSVAAAYVLVLPDWRASP